MTGLKYFMEIYLITEPAWEVSWVIMGKTNLVYFTNISNLNLQGMKMLKYNLS